MCICNCTFIANKTYTNRGCEPILLATLSIGFSLMHRFASVCDWTKNHWTIIHISKSIVPRAFKAQCDHLFSLGDHHTYDVIKGRVGSHQRQVAFYFLFVMSTLCSVFRICKRGEVGSAFWQPATEWRDARRGARGDPSLWCRGNPTTQHSYVQSPTLYGTTSFRLHQYSE